jgi:hypothetical protein
VRLPAQLRALPHGLESPPLKRLKRRRQVQPQLEVRERAAQPLPERHRRQRLRSSHAMPGTSLLLL